MFSTRCITLTPGVIDGGTPLFVYIINILLCVFGIGILLLFARCILLLGQWVWTRTVPDFIRNRSVPGITGQGFQGVAVFWFVDKYSFRVPGASEDLGKIIADFFAQRGAKVQDSGENLTFKRGSRFCSFFLAHLVPCRETSFLQRINVELKRELRNDVEVCIQYTVQTFCMLRVRPSGLYDEVVALQSCLKGKG